MHPASAPATVELPTRWRRLGLVLPRGDRGACGADVVGDPCIVRDESLPGWRMVLFAAPPGHAQAVALDSENPRGAAPARWRMLGPLPFANPEALFGGSTHKPWLVLDGDDPSRAARIDGRYALLGVSWRDRRKVVQRAWSTSLAGPWEVEPGALIDLGEAGAFDAKHVDAVSAWWFAARGEILYAYMGYPLAPQPWPTSPLGSAQALAVGAPHERPRKLGPSLPPCAMPGHWAAGYVGGFQLLRGRAHRWIALVNASPTAPRAEDGAVHREEPPPSLGGFAVCDEAWPVRGWRWRDAPIERIEDLPREALDAGEGVNLWRHFALVLPDGALAVYYNSGRYGTEQLYARLSIG